VKFTQVHWFGKEFHTTVVTHKFAKITILLCCVGVKSSIIVFDKHYNWDCIVK